MDMSLFVSRKEALLFEKRSKNFCPAVAD